MSPTRLFVTAGQTRLCLASARSPHPLQERRVWEEWRPHYTSPEVLLGNKSSPSSDVWSLGVALYFLLTGTVPYADASGLGLIREIQEAPTPDLRELVPDAPPALVGILAQCLAKKPRRRYRSGNELALALDDLVQGRERRPTGWRAWLGGWGR